VRTRASVLEKPSGPSCPSSPAGRGFLELEDGSRFEGAFFGAAHATDGEVVFNTGMVGYTESLTDPSYRGQILVLTYPLIGNYGVPAFRSASDRFESKAIHVRGLVVASYVDARGHWEAEQSLGSWLGSNHIPGLGGVDTRELTKRLRRRGTMLGRIVPEGDAASEFAVADPSATDLVSEVTSLAPVAYHPAPGRRSPHIVIVDCGCKRSIVNELRRRGCRVTAVPYRCDLTALDCDGILLSNGPGDPARCGATVEAVARMLVRPDPVPVAGICLGCQILARAVGGSTYKLPYGHRGQNQPVQEAGTGRCLITSQNHGYAVAADSLPEGWEVWYTNLNDGTVEGIRHRSRPYAAVQFHPEAAPGPTDSGGFFDDFLEAVHGR